MVIYYIKCSEQQFQGHEHELSSSGSGQCPEVGSCEHDNGYSHCINGLD
jgi:hypothetical protein